MHGTGGRQASNPRDVTFDMLVVHGSGAAGGFAAGFLKGWGEIQDPKYTRPEFDYVTGASSGASLAPLAFIGEENSYQLAYEVALEPPIFNEPGFFTLWPTRSSVISNEMTLLPAGFVAEGIAPISHHQLLIVDDLKGMILVATEL